MREVTLWYENGIPDYLELKENGEIISIVNIDENGYTENGKHYIDKYYELGKK